MQKNKGQIPFFIIFVSFLNTTTMIWYEYDLSYLQI